VAEFSHLDEQGRAHMVDVGSKPPTDREATAESFVAMLPETRSALFGGGLPKGDAVAVARLAAIGAVKRTADLVPLCHPLMVSGIDVSVDPAEDGARIEVTVRTTGRTGVEMEAMTGAAIGAVALYDMIKGVDRGAEIGPVRLLAKSGGRSGEWRR
jgi:cyclic pyranopterin phosphate synthase